MDGRACGREAGCGGVGGKRWEGCGYARAEDVLDLAEHALCGGGGGILALLLLESEAAVVGRLRGGGGRQG